MPFNFEHNEASTNDLPERNTELDRYGVWVKTPPRTIHDETEPETAEPDEVFQSIVIEDISDITANTAADTTTDTAAPPDAFKIEDFELPDFTEFDLTDDSAELPEEQEEPSVQADSLPMEEIKFTDDVAADIAAAAAALPKIDDTAEDETTENAEPAEVAEPARAENISAESATEQDSTDESFFDNAAYDELLNIEDFELPADTAPQSTEVEFADSDVAAPPEEAVGDTLFEDGEISLDSFFDEDTSVSLDEFMPSESKKEKSDILDEPAMDIALSFDDDFVMNTAADPVTQMETVGGEPSADQDQTADDGFNFDDMFDNIIDESQPEPEKPAVQENIEFDEVTDFDDLLDSITDTPPPSSNTGKTDGARPAAVIDYDISVTMDDDSQEFSTVQTETDDDDAITEIPLYGDSGIEKTNENEEASLDRTRTSQYTSTSYTDDSDFDIDKIMAEVEDIGGENMPADTANRFQDEEEQNDTQPTGNDIFDADFFETPKADDDTVSAENDKENTDTMALSDQEFDLSDFDVKDPEIDSVFTEENTEDAAFELPPDFTEPDTTAVTESEETSFDDIPVEMPDTVFDEPVEEASSETDFVEPDTADMPDTFDEDERQTAVESTECIEETAVGACAEPAAETTILRQIAAELATLREEISSLKNDFEDMKKHGAQPAAETPAAGGFFAENSEDETIALSGNELSNILNTADFTEESGAVAAQEPTSAISEDSGDSETDTETEPGWETGAGFFDEHTGDETIALSGNELSNILNTADFTEEPDTVEVQEPVITENDDAVSAADEYEESDNGLPAIDFESEKLEEPVLENIDFTAGTEAEHEQDLPQEIEVPKVEDILVESSDTDLIDDGSAAAIQDDEPVEPAENAIDEPIEPAGSETLPEETPVNEEAPAEEEREPEVAAETETEQEEETSDEPTEEVFNSAQWAAPETPRQESAAETETKSEAAQDEIPGELKQEIKSVLSYMDQLLENLPEEKIAEFAQSEHFELYKKLFTELGLS